MDLVQGTLDCPLEFGCPPITCVDLGPRASEPGSAAIYQIATSMRNFMSSLAVVHRMFVNAKIQWGSYKEKWVELYMPAHKTESSPLGFQMMMYALLFPIMIAVSLLATPAAGIGLTAAIMGTTEAVAATAGAAAKAALDAATKAALNAERLAGKLGGEAAVKAAQAAAQAAKEAADKETKAIVAASKEAAQISAQNIAISGNLLGNFIQTGIFMAAAGATRAYTESWEARAAKTNYERLEALSGTMIEMLEQASVIKDVHDDFTIHGTSHGANMRALFEGGTWADTDMLPLSNPNIINTQNQTSVMERVMFSLAVQFAWHTERVYLQSFPMTLDEFNSHEAVAGNNDGRLKHWYKGYGYYFQS
jgi:hypothetical protein